MDIINIMLYAALSPVIISVLLLGIFKLIKTDRKPNAEIGALILKCLVGGSIAAGISLIGVLAWGGWYTYKTGYDANQAPLAWIFLYGPASFALGEVIGFIIWITKIKKAT